MTDFAIIGYVVINMILGTQGERVLLGGAPTCARVRLPILRTIGGIILAVGLILLLIGLSLFRGVI
jgi:hypothetical protein